MHDRASRELARQWDAHDALARFRKRFHRPPDQIYLDGDSLGLCSHEAERALLRMLADWKTKGSGAGSGATAGWGGLAGNLAARLGRLVGAEPAEVAIGGTTALNLHQLLATIYRRQFHRPRVLVDGFYTSSDRAAVRSHLELRGLEAESQLLVVPVNGARLLEESAIESALADPTVQLAILPTVVYETGQLLDVARLARAARRHGVVLGLDLSHSLGVMPHALDDWQIDFAIWGHGKFVNAGPGAAAGLYLHRRHLGEGGELKPGLGGRRSRRGILDLFRAGGPEGARLLQLAPEPILSMAPLEGALRPIEEAGLERLREKSIDLTHFLRSAIETEIPTIDFVTPRDAARRGGHIALLHAAAREICEELRRNGVSADFRAPDMICLAPSPLYNSFVECWDAVQILRRVLELNAQARSTTQLVS